MRKTSDENCSNGTKLGAGRWEFSGAGGEVRESGRVENKREHEERVNTREVRREREGGRNIPTGSPARPEQKEGTKKGCRDLARRPSRSRLCVPTTGCPTGRLTCFAGPARREGVSGVRRDGVACTSLGSCAGGPEVHGTGANIDTRHDTASLFLTDPATAGLGTCKRSKSF